MVARRRWHLTGRAPWRGADAGRGGAAAGNQGTHRAHRERAAGRGGNPDRGLVGGEEAAVSDAKSDAKSDVFFLAEFAAGAPSHAAQELASGAASLTKQSGGSAVGLAYGEGAVDGAPSLRTWGAARVLVLGTHAVPAITHAAAVASALRDGGVALLAPATPNGRDLAAATVGLLSVPAFGPARAVRFEEGGLKVEASTLQGAWVTISEPADGAPTPAVVMVLAGTFTPKEGSGTAEVETAETDDGQLGAARIE